MLSRTEVCIRYVNVNFSVISRDILTLVQCGKTRQKIQLKTISKCACVLQRVLFYYNKQIKMALFESSYFILWVWIEKYRSNKSKMSATYHWSLQYYVYSYATVTINTIKRRIRSSVPSACLLPIALKCYTGSYRT